MFERTDDLINQPSAKPTRKVTATALGGAGVTLAVWVLSLYGVQIPSNVSAALTLIVSAGSGYLAKEKVGESSSVAE